jgi:hypothetical protein
MTLPSFLLAGSLVANAALLALLVAGTNATDRTTPSTVTRDTPSHRAAPSTSTAGDATTSPDAAAWASLKPAELPGLLDRLHAAGFPPAIARALLAEQVRLQFAPRRAALNLKEKERPFWEPGTYDAKTEAARAQILKEQNQALKDLLGSDAAIDDSAALALRRQFPHFSEAKIAALRRAQEVYNEKTEAMFSSGLITSADLTAGENARRAEIAKVLTPEELEDYELRVGNIANTLRRQLAVFNPTEQEFRTLYELQRAFDEQYRDPIVAGSITPEQRQLIQQRGEAQRQLTEQIKATLGDVRFAEYQRSIDNNYQQTTKLVARLELPPETANQVYVVQQDFQQRLATLQSDRTLAPEDRNAQLAVLAAEAQSKVTSVLGPRGFEAYKQYGGSWLQQLEPRKIAIPGPAGGINGVRSGRGGG